MSESTEEVVAEVVVPDIDASATLQKAGIYYVWGPIVEGSLKAVHEQILLRHYLSSKQPAGPVQLIVNSGGGDLDEVMSLVDLLANVQFNVATAGFGTCASGGAMLLACGTKGLRTIAPGCALMIHTYSWSATGNHHDLLASRKAEDDTHNRIVDFWVRHSKYENAKEVEKFLLKKNDVWLTAKEAVGHGIADHVAGVLR